MKGKIIKGIAGFYYVYVEKKYKKKKTGSTNRPTSLLTP